ncbi:hypothetical protein BC835DRAFT_17646 [Cytidiella melzeri]|nr:hypothetical protein BC835DRAFT_17646 [Cytidiella melzeri]
MATATWFNSLSFSMTVIVQISTPGTILRTMPAAPEDLQLGCALGSDGALKDAKDILWYQSDTDTQPIDNTSTQPKRGKAPATAVGTTRDGGGRSRKLTWKAAGKDPLKPVNSQPIKSFFPPRPKPSGSQKHTRPTAPDNQGSGVDVDGFTEPVDIGSDGDGESFIGKSQDAQDNNFVEDGDEEDLESSEGAESEESDSELQRVSS